MEKYGLKIDKKWQKKWQESNLYTFNKDDLNNKLYVLEMFSYPSGSNLHVGHWYNFGLTDSYARFKRIEGYNVFQPMGFDAFGLPAENYAIKTGIHPKDSTYKNIEIMESQLREMGASFNWENEVITCDPSYYKWTQWLFLKLYEKNLAYRKNAPVNWCPSCNTVLANEQVIEGYCERCESEVTKKNLTQWFFKITDYAEDLLEGLHKIDWPEKTKAMQKHWIGKSVGAEATFKVKDMNLQFDIFTTRVDTLYGVTYAVLAPENELVKKITTKEQEELVNNYIEETKKKSDIDRQSATREKTGVFTGSYAINPINNEVIPIWIADYVLGTYGTGAVMAVPAHDARDYEFAKKYSLNIKKVIDGGSDELYTEDGILINSDEFSGLSSEDGRVKITEKLKSIKLGTEKINYRLRDWLVSRQRYWGAPIPIVYCDDCGAVPVPYENLPVELPYNVEFTPDGKSPLSKSSEFINTTCPKCGKEAKRDCDTLDTFVCSSWYFLRYPDNKNDNEPFNTDIINKMLPVDKYVGGPEHACMHLLYARFITKALKDMGYINFDEPFKSLTHQGMILGADGQKMSKSRGNTIVPDEYIKKYGSDVFRMNLMFSYAYTEGGAWSDDSIKSMGKYFERLERILDSAINLTNSNGKETIGSNEKELNYWRNYSIKNITEDLNILQFNTSIARIMEFTNAISKYIKNDNINNKFLKDVLKDFIILIAPLAPHFSEEMWERLGINFKSVFTEKWPKYDEKALVKDEVEIAIQVNGKIKCRMNIPSNSSEDIIKKLSLEKDEIQKLIEGKNIIKVIVIKGSLVNIVVK